MSLVEQKEVYLSLPTEIREGCAKRGVVAFIFNRNGEVLLLRENSTNEGTGKISGSYGVVCETAKNGELWWQTLKRGIREELGVDPQQTDLFKIDHEGGFLGETLFVERVLAQVVTVFWTGDNETLLSAQGDGEVTPVGWISLENLVDYPLRPGVRNVLAACGQNQVLEGIRQRFISQS